MEADTLRTLAHLIRTQRVASLGTLRQGAPLVSQVVYAFRPDFLAFYLHLSRLAQHTQALLKDAQLSLLIAAPDDGLHDPQLLPRVSIQSSAYRLARNAPDYEAACRLYQARFPNSLPTFDLGDFELYQFAPQSARLVIGFGQAYTLAPGHFVEAAGLLESYG